MAMTLTQDEVRPSIRSPIEGLADDVDSGPIWDRIEDYVAWRWTVRSVRWIVEGPGDWSPPLRPTSVVLVERWTGEAWEEAIAPPSPFGGLQLDCGLYRVEAEVGGGPIPAGVQEAVRRLSLYTSDSMKPGLTGRSGASSGSYRLGNSVTADFERSPEWIARALINSGAADLLRPYRRA